MPPTGFSSATFYKLRAKFGGMEASGAKRLRDMEVGDLLRESSTINDNRVYRLYKLADRPTGRPVGAQVRKRRGEQRLKLERVPLHGCTDEKVKRVP